MQKVIEIVDGGSRSRAGFEFSGHYAAEAGNYSRFVRSMLSVFSVLTHDRFVTDDWSAAAIRRSGG